MSDLGFSIREITVAVRDLGAAGDRLGGMLQSSPDKPVSFPQKNFELKMGGVWADDFHIAMVEPTSDSGPVARFLEKRGEGIYEVNLVTDDLPAAIEHMKGQGVEFVSEEPTILRDYEWRGEIFSELRIVFADPSTTHGILFELGQWVK
jgi:hypothetical protein